MFEWCEGYTGKYTFGGTGKEGLKNLRGKHRCPKCGKRLELQIVECETFDKEYSFMCPPETGCWHGRVPPHKPKGSKIPKKQPKRRRKSCRRTRIMGIRSRR